MKKRKKKLDQEKKAIEFHVKLKSITLNGTILTIKVKMILQIIRKISRFYCRAQSKKNSNNQEKSEHKNLFDYEVKNFPTETFEEHSIVEDQPVFEPNKPNESIDQSETSDQNDELINSNRYMLYDDSSSS